jgi:hypothetical protein
MASYREIADLLLSKTQRRKCRTRGDLAYDLAYSGLHEVPHQPLATVQTAELGRDPNRLDKASIVPLEAIVDLAVGPTGDADANYLIPCT